MSIRHRDSLGVSGRLMIGAAVFVTLLIAGISVAQAQEPETVYDDRPSVVNELIQSVGLSRAVEGDATVTPYAQLALRTSWTSFFKTELGVAYRQDEYNGGDFKVRQWPITGSLWLAPVPALYLGGGVGWYNSSVDYSDEIGYDDFTTQDFGVHVGGGFTAPLGSNLGLDLSAKYVFLEEQDRNDLAFDPSHWVTSAGLAIRF